MNREERTDKYPTGRPSCCVTLYNISFVDRHTVRGLLNSLDPLVDRWYTSEIQVYFGDSSFFSSGSGNPKRGGRTTRQPGPLGAELSRDARMRTREGSQAKKIQLTAFEP